MVQIFSLMDRLLKRENLDLKLTAYRCALQSPVPSQDASPLGGAGRHHVPTAVVCLLSGLLSSINCGALF